LLGNQKQFHSPCSDLFAFLLRGLAQVQRATGAVTATLHYLEQTQEHQTTSVYVNKWLVIWKMITLIKFVFRTVNNEQSWLYFHEGTPVKVIIYTLTHTHTHTHIVRMYIRTYTHVHTYIQT